MKKCFHDYSLALVAVLAVVFASCDMPMGRQMISIIADEKEDTTPPEGMVLITAGESQIYMDKTEVTNAQFKAFLIENPSWQKGHIEVRFHDGRYLNHWSGNNYPFGKDNHPVTYVNWYAAMAYAEWAGKRLPLELEWEYAARGGLVGKKYPHGDRMTLDDANYDGILRDSTPVGSYPANGYGLYDMAGNAWEWCLDAPDDFESVEWLFNNYTDVRDRRVLRGGAWDTPKIYVQIDEGRSLNLPTDAGESTGFRCVWPISP